MMHVRWEASDCLMIQALITLSKGYFMEYNRDVYDTWRIGDYEEAMGGEIEEDEESNEDTPNKGTE